MFQDQLRKHNERQPKFRPGTHFDTVKKLKPEPAFAVPNGPNRQETASEAARLVDSVPSPPHAPISNLRHPSAWPVDGSCSTDPSSSEQKQSSQEARKASKVVVRAAKIHQLNNKTTHRRPRSRERKAIKKRDEKLEAKPSDYEHIFHAASGWQASASDTNPDNERDTDKPAPPEAQAKQTDRAEVNPKEKGPKKKKKKRKKKRDSS